RMKDAAKRVGTDKPKSSPKPVSLQPLRPAGTPNRSAYGNTAAAMRQAKDALSKADAKQGIMDAMVKPVEPGAFGGMGLSDTAVGGAAGKMDRNFAYSNKEPWWWDLMKTRSQMEWEENFKRKWDWIKWGDKLAQNILGGLINCLVTGDDGGEVGAFLGSGGGAGGRKGKCCGIGKETFEKEAAGKYSFTESGCKDYLKVKYGEAEYKSKCNDVWIEPRDGSGERKGIIATRLGCLGLSIGGYGSGDPSLTEDSAGGECEDLVITEPYKFRVVPQGKAQKWHTYHWIVAHNFVPLEYTQDKANAKGVLLCSEGSDHLQMSSHYSSMGATDYLTTDKPTFQAEYAAYEAAKRADASLTFTSYLAKKYQLDSATANEISAREASVASATTDQQKNELLQKMCDLAYDYFQKATVHTTDKQRVLGDMYPRTDDLCVIYLAQGNQLEYGQFQRNTVEMLKGLIEKSHGMIVPQGETSQQMAEKAFKQLDLAFIEAASMKHKLGYAKWGQSGNKLEEPILYDRFENAYIIHRGVTASATGSRNNVDKRKYRLEDEEYVRSKKCNFDADVHLECTDNSLPPFATVKKGNLARHPVGDIQVTAHFTPVQGSEQITVADFSATITAAQPANVYPFVYQTLKDAIPQGKNADGTVAWKVSYSRNGVPFTQTRTCIFGAGGEPAPPIPHPECTEGQIQPLDQVDQDGCKLQKRCVSAHWVKEKVDPNCPSTPPVVGSKVRFYPTISKMPKGVLIDGKPTDRPALDNNNLEKQWPECKVDGVSGTELEYYDRETHEYMKGVISAYTAANGTSTSKPMEDYVTQTGERPTIAQVVDAMRIASA
ncbi:MAG: hypothetical protein II913_00640, partial [Elusimicrobiaceae bacterium]|nr:hypothetical protein [Elusimicrobiaceae bacterium]